MSKYDVVATAPQMADTFCDLMPERRYNAMVNDPAQLKEWLDNVNGGIEEGNELYGTSDAYVTALPSSQDLVDHYGSWGAAAEALGEKRWCGFSWVYGDDELTTDLIPDLAERRLEGQKSLLPIVEAILFKDEKRRNNNVCSFHTWDLYRRDKHVVDCITDLPAAVAYSELQEDLVVRVPTAWELKNVFGTFDELLDLIEASHFAKVAAA